MRSSEFVIEKYTDGVLKDLEAELVGIKDNIQDAKDLLADLEMEEMLLQLVVDYTKMFREGWADHSDRVLDLIKVALGKREEVDKALKFKEKIDKLRGRSFEKIDTGVKPDETSEILSEAMAYHDYTQALLPDKNYQKDVHDLNRDLIQLSRKNEAEELDDLLQSTKVRPVDIASYAAWEEGYRKDSKEALAVLEKHFEELAELAERVAWRKKLKAEKEVDGSSPNESLNWESEQDVDAAVEEINSNPILQSIYALLGEIETEPTRRHIQKANSLLLRAAEHNDYAAIKGLCSVGGLPFPLKNLDYKKALTYASVHASKEAEELLEYYFRDLIEAENDSEEVETVKLDLFTEKQVVQAAMDAARVWAKTSDDRGKFSLRLFINMLETIIGPEADIDTEVAEYALKRCKSVVHVSGDIWMEVN